MRLHLASLAIVLSIANANAGVILCDAPKVLVGDEPDNNPVVSVEVSYKQEDHAWRIFHKMVNGQVVARAEQYAITDWSNANKLQWTGSLNRNRSLQMIGEVKINQRGEITYWEWMYDRGKGNQLVMQMGAVCRKAEQPRQLERPSSEITPQVKPPVLAYGGVGVNVEAKQAKLKPVRDAVPIHPHLDGRVVTMDVIVGGQPLRMMIDTGSTITVITRDIAHHIVMDGQGSWGPIIESKMADDRVIKLPSIIVHSVRIGNHEVKNVRAAITDGESLLMGFPILNSIGPFTINTRTRELIFDTSSIANSN